jgi:hypothetical protein
MKNKFHKSFIESVVIVAIVTIFAIVSNKFLSKYYSFPAKYIEYSSQKSYR